MDIVSSKSIRLKTGGSSIEMTKDGTIKIKCKKLVIDSMASIDMKTKKLTTDATLINIKGQFITTDARTIKTSATGPQRIKGLPLELNPPA